MPIYKGIPNDDLCVRIAEAAIKCLSRMRAYAEVNAAGALNVLRKGYYSTAYYLLTRDKGDKHKIVIIVGEGIKLCLLV